jgi:hypothetical protein
VRDLSVGHIIGKAEPQPHRITPWAKINGLKITYPASPLAPSKTL